MNSAIRRFFTGIPILRGIYRKARRSYNNRDALRAARDYFVNFDDYRRALEKPGAGLIDLQAKDGLKFTIRLNHTDAAILREVFFEKCYVRELSVPARPVVVDIGGFIGDFALYAAKYLDARKVVVCEPSPNNCLLLRKNIANNHYEDRIQVVSKAVTGGEDVMMDIDAPDGGQARVSAYGNSNGERKRIPGVTLASLMEEHGLDVIDLLKMDCEGGEYRIFSTLPTEIYKRIRNIVFEYHEVEGFQDKLKLVKQRLRDEGYSLKIRGSLISASRA